jgi:hypothetical protein
VEPRSRASVPRFRPDRPAARPVPLTTAKAGRAQTLMVDAETAW